MQRLMRLLRLSTLPAGEVVLKGAAGSAVYYAGSGWTGELETLGVLQGYRIHVESAGNLKYDPAASAKKSLSVGTSGTLLASTNVSATVSERRKLLQEYGLQPERFEHSATLIAEVVSAGGKGIHRRGRPAAGIPRQ
jgi:hypothetical protein